MLSFFSFARNLVIMSAFIGIAMCLPSYYIGGTMVSTTGALQTAATSFEAATHVNSSSVLLQMTIANLNQNRAVIPVMASYVINGAAHVYLWWQWQVVREF